MTENGEKLAEAIFEQVLGYSEGYKQDNYYCHYCNAEVYTRDGYPPDFKHDKDCAYLLAGQILRGEIK